VVHRFAMGLEESEGGDFWAEDRDLVKAARKVYCVDSSYKAKG
jgi:hypothetical protein